MRRFAALAAAFLLAATPCAAKIMVVCDRQGAGESEDLRSNLARQRKLFLNLLDRTGADYVEVDRKSAKAAFMAAGAQTWLFGTAGAYAETFDGVAVFGTLGSAGGARTWRAESTTLTRTGYVPQVPMLFIATNQASLATIEPFNTLTTDTTGAGVLIPVTKETAYIVSSAKPIILSTYVNPVTMIATPPAGGMRKLIGTAVGNYPFRAGGGAAVDCINCDSVAAFSANPDSAVMWERLWTHRSDGHHQVFVNAGGGGLNTADSLYVANSVLIGPAEGEVFLMLAGLARLDSLTSGGVWGKRKIPIKVAVTIDGGWSRNGRRHPYGFLDADSASLKATIDSLQTLDIPAVLGVNIDSLAGYPRDKTWWAGWTKLHYTPQNRGGLDSAAAGNGNASWQQPRDVWGRFRSRAAFGDTSAAGDTTIYGLLRASLWKCDSTFGYDKVSRFALPPYDDWSPKNLNGSRNDPPVDSVLFAAYRAGFRGIRIDGQSRDSDPGYLRANPHGYYRDQGWYAGSRGVSMKLLAHQGYGISGAIKTTTAMGDSATNAAIGKVYIELNRAWTAITQNEDRNTDSFPSDLFSGSTGGAAFADVDYPSHDVLYPPRKGNVLRFCVNDFSGIPNGPPARTGFWVLKTLKNEFDAINTFAGRTVICFDYIENVTP